VRNDDKEQVSRSFVQQIYARIANIAKSYELNKSGTIVDSADAVEKPRGKKIQGVAVMSKSVSFVPSKKRDLNKLGVEKGEGSNDR